MNDKTQYLLKLAKHNVKAYIANLKTKAAMVAGSVAEGICDEYSDCNMSIYYDELVNFVICPLSFPCLRVISL